MEKNAKKIIQLFSFLKKLFSKKKKIKWKLNNKLINIKFEF